MVSFMKRMMMGLLYVSVYDVTRRQTFLDLLDTWGKEVELYSTNQGCIKLVVGNKMDRVS